MKSVLLKTANRMASLMEGCAKLGVFPKKWKEARLVLIPKKDNKGQTCGYRPLSIISGLAKAFEVLVASWLELALVKSPCVRRSVRFQKWKVDTARNRTGHEQMGPSKKKRNAYNDGYSRREKCIRNHE